MTTFKDILYKKNDDETWAEWTKRVPDNDEDKLDYIGETIYAKIYENDKEKAGKITGMLLNLDVEELIVLLESNDLLEDKIKEEYQVLRELEEYKMSEFKDITYKKNDDETWAEWNNRLPTDDDKRDYIGETIYAKIYDDNKEKAGKITGMLLVMDVEYLIPLLESHELLDEKIKEAYQILREDEEIKMSDEEVLSSEVEYLSAEEKVRVSNEALRVANEACRVLKEEVYKEEEEYKIFEEDEYLGLNEKEREGFFYNYKLQKYCEMALWEAYDAEVQADNLMATVLDNKYGAWGWGIKEEEAYKKEKSKAEKEERKKEEKEKEEKEKKEKEIRDEERYKRCEEYNSQMETFDLDPYHNRNDTYKVATITVAEMIEALSKLPPDAKLAMTESGYWSRREFARVFLPEPYIVGTRPQDWTDLPDGTQVYCIGHSHHFY